MNRQSFRSPLARAVGLGSAKKGSQHWWAERVTAVALVPLTLWFVASIIAHAGSDYATFIGWLQAPLTTLLVILLLIALFHHSALGLQVVIEDYVHSGFKFAAVIAVRLSCYGLGCGVPGITPVSICALERLSQRLPKSFRHAARPASTQSGSALTRRGNNRSQSHAAKLQAVRPKRSSSLAAGPPGSPQPKCFGGNTTRAASPC